MSLDEVVEKPGFWLLGAGGTVAVLFGWIMSKRSGWMTLPLWQMLVLLVVVWVASVVFASKD